MRVSESPPLLVPGVSAPSAPAAATASSPRTTSGRRGRRSTTCAASPAPSAPSSSRPARSSTSSPARTTPCSARTTTSRTTAARPPVSHESASPDLQISLAHNFCTAISQSIQPRFWDEALSGTGICAISEARLVFERRNTRTGHHPTSPSRAS